MSIWHLVLIRADVDAHIVTQVAAELDTARAAGQLAFDSLEIGARLAPKVSDGIMGGELNTGSGGDHILLVRLADETSLAAYYAAPAHSIIRRRFLCRVSAECAKLYEDADADEDRSEILFDRIETIAADIMKRIDIVIAQHSGVGGSNAGQGYAEWRGATAQP